MRAPLVIAVAQPRCVPGDVAGNAARHAEAVRASGAGVVLFPELSLTGYDLESPALDPAAAHLSALREACSRTGATALAGAPVAGEDGREHIAVIAVDGRGCRVAYRKQWLGEEEARRFAPGPGPAVLDAGGRRLGLAICRDLTVERHAADTAALGVDAYLASTVKHPSEADAQQRRAAEVAAGLGVWVAVASAAGAAGLRYPVTAGGSGVWSPSGEIAARAGSAPGAVVRATLD